MSGFLARIAAAFRTEGASSRNVSEVTPRADNIAITPAVLASLGADRPAEWAPALDRAMRAYGILANKQRAAAFLATVLHETGGLKRLVESMNYSPDGLLRTWPSRFDRDEAAKLGRTMAKAADERGIAERVYGNRMGNYAPGDGYLFRGRGLIQITGRSNYEAACRALARPLDEFMRWIVTPEGAAETAAWWWTEHGCNDLADMGDVTAWRRRVNGGVIGLTEVREKYAHALGVL